MCCSEGGFRVYLAKWGENPVKERVRAYQSEAENVIEECFGGIVSHARAYDCDGAFYVDVHVWREDAHRFDASLFVDEMAKRGVSVESVGDGDGEGGTKIEMFRSKEAGL